MPDPSASFDSLRRFHCPNLPHPRLSESTVTLDPDQTRHARKVLRLRAGDPIELFDGRGRTARGVIEVFEAGFTVCRVSEVAEMPPPTPRLTIATAIPKGPRADEMVNQLSQVGCDRLVPLVTQRSEVDPRDARLDKWSRIAVESAKQSHRAFVMAVEPARRLAEVMAEPADVKLIATIGDFGLADLGNRLRAATQVVVLIGPAGDWTDDELVAARDAGFASWTLGPNVLRVESAAVAAAAIVRYLAVR
jgi:16S rRNA (uracil1498-N3)-methyltransferase